MPFTRAFNQTLVIHHVPSLHYSLPPASSNAPCMPHKYYEDGPLDKNNMDQVCHCFLHYDHSLISHYPVSCCKVYFPSVFYNSKSYPLSPLNPNHHYENYNNCSSCAIDCMRRVKAAKTLESTSTTFFLLDMLVLTGISLC